MSHATDLRVIAPTDEDEAILERFTLGQLLHYGNADFRDASRMRLRESLRLQERNALTDRTSAGLNTAQAVARRLDLIEARDGLLDTQEVY